MLTKSVAVVAAAALGATLGLAARGVDAAMAQVPSPVTRAVGTGEGAAPVRLLPTAPAAEAAATS